MVSESGPISYSSILKAPKGSILRAKKKVEVARAKKGVIVATEKMKEEMAAAEKKETEEPEKKKVKKKDPIEFDLFSALNMKRQQGKKKEQVLGGKVRKEA